MEERMQQMHEPDKKGRAVTALALAACIILGCMLLCNLTIIIKGTVSPERPPSIFGVTPMVVLSGSMSGTQEGHVEIGDLVFIGSTDPDKVEVGDVVAYMNGSTAVTHRVTAIEESGDGSRLFTTKGDANNAEDTSKVTEAQLIGVYWGRIPKLGDFALFLQQPIGMLLFAGVPLMAFIIYDIIRRQRESNRQNQRNEELAAELMRLRGMSEEPETQTEVEEEQLPL